MKRVCQRWRSYVGIVGSFGCMRLSRTTCLSLGIGGQRCRRLIAGAYAKVDRAGEHLKTLDTALTRWRKTSRHSLQGKTDPDSGAYVFNAKPGAPPPRIGVLVGDVVSNLRPALDYLVFALAALDSGKAQDGTQFPITSTSKLFEAELRKGRLRGLSDPHVAAIKKLQPHDGRNKWAAILRDISNPDKHRHLNVLATESGGGFEIIYPEGTKPPQRKVVKKRTPSKGSSYLSSKKPSTTPASGKTPRHGALLNALRDAEASTKKPGVEFSLPAEHPMADSDVHVYVGLRIFVAFENGLPVIGTLEALEEAVRGVLDAFQPEFER